MDALAIVVCEARERSQCIIGNEWVYDLKEARVKTDSEIVDKYQVRIHYGNTDRRGGGGGHVSWDSKNAWRLQESSINLSA